MNVIANDNNEFGKNWLSWDDSSFAEARRSTLDDITRLKLKELQDNYNNNNDIFIVEYQLHGCPDVLTFTGTSTECDYIADEVAELCSQLSIKKVQ